MRELFSAWSGLIHVRNRSAVTPVTGVTSVHSLDLRRDRCKEVPVTRVTEKHSDDFVAMDVTGVTPPNTDRLQRRLPNDSDVTYVTSVTREEIGLLSVVEREAWEERAAIMEYDGEFSRRESEWQAYHIVKNGV